MCSGDVASVYETSEPSEKRGPSQNTYGCDAAMDASVSAWFLPWFWPRFWLGFGLQMVANFHERRVLLSLKHRLWDD